MGVRLSSFVGGAGSPCLELDAMGYLTTYLCRTPSAAEIEQYLINGSVGIQEKHEIIEPSLFLDRQFAQLRQIERHSGFGDSIDRTYRYFEDEWEDVIKNKEIWQTNTEGYYLLMKNRDSKKGIITQCQTRFSIKRKKDTRMRMESFSKKIGKLSIKKGLQITLTTDPKKFDSLESVGNAWYNQLEKFLDWMNLRLRRAGKKEISCYLTAKEITQSGLCHTHIGLYAQGIAGKILMRKYNRHTKKHEYVREYLFPKEDVKKEWSKLGVGEITWINAAPVNEAIDYVTKHVSKSWGGKSNDMLEAFLHETGLRQWTSSRGALPKPLPSVETWEKFAFAYNPFDASVYRKELLAEGAKIIKDELSQRKDYRLLDLNMHSGG